MVRAFPSGGTIRAPAREGYQYSLFEMPIYEYERGDGTRFEIRQGFSDEALETDPESGQEVRRILSSPGMMYRGEGVHSTSYRSRPKDEKASGD